MSAAASALAQSLAQHSDEDVLQALQLLVSLRPAFQEQVLETVQQEPLKRYTGMVASFILEKGFGFIASDESTEEFGRDTFLSDKEIGCFKVGDEVAFTVIANRDGKPQARLLTSTDGAIAAYDNGSEQHTQVAQQPAHWQHSLAEHSSWQQTPAEHSSWNVGAPAKRPRLVQKIIPAVSIPPPAVVPGAGLHESEIPPTPPPPVLPPGSEHGGRLLGTIVSFSPEKRYGFISSDASQQMFGKDTFLSDMEIKDFKVGDVVSYAIAFNKNGHPQARDLQVPAQEHSAQTQAYVAEEDRRYSGVIAQFWSDKKYGFIHSPEALAKFGKDVWISDLEIGMFTTGHAVTFRVVLNKKGAPQARDLQAGHEHC